MMATYEERLSRMKADWLAAGGMSEAWDGMLMQSRNTLARLGTTAERIDRMARRYWVGVRP